MTKNEFFRYLFWEWIEPVGVALCIALIIIHYFMALYIIPTGSMQPTLRGKNDYGSGDKVLVNKFIYRFTKPERWDVFVFKFPYKVLNCDNCGQDGLRDIGHEEDYEIPEGKICRVCGVSDFSVIEKDYIKRCVGLPGDILTIHDGNLLRKVDGKWNFIPKTELAQGELWIPVYRHELDAENFSRCWQWQRSNAMMSDEDASLVFKAGVQYRLLWKNRFMLLGRGDKGVNQNRGGDLDSKPVGDLRIEMRFKEAPLEGVLNVGLEWNRVKMGIKLDWAKRALVIYQHDKSLVKVKLKAQSIEQVSFWRVDGTLNAKIGEEVTSVNLKDLRPATSVTNSVMPFIDYQGKAMSVADIRVDRDIFYVESSSTAGPGVVYKVPENQYWAMGDNSHYSSDSRDWKGVPEEMLIGKALSVVLPFSRIKLIY